ncbi:WSCD family member [Trichoplax sp. H2]|nr:WSCD family member [Trichoplax sp. H2]|eukprot:RDD44639.1 WSCD family member [Trichoplax sp. H2]
MDNLYHHRRRKLQHRTISYFSASECAFAFFLASIFIVLVVVAPARLIYYSVLEAKGECSERLSYIKRNSPVTALVGPPGCGTQWVRYIIQQISGHHVGNIYGRTGASVVAVETNYLNLVGPVDKVIVVVRSPFECLRVSFDGLYSKPRQIVASRSRYLNRNLWENHVRSAGKNWEKYYKTYLAYDGPILIVHYSNLVTSLRSEMHRISQFLNLNPTKLKLDCVARSPISIRFKRTPVKLPFNPLAFVATNIQNSIRNSEKVIMDMLNQRIHQEEARKESNNNRITLLP